ncbi:CopG family transcriptional regulator [Brevibacillus sp. IT-7CA2]
MLQEHQRKIERLVGMDREAIRARRIQAIVEGVRNGQLSIKDVTSYTNITTDQLAELIKHNYE